MSRSHQAWGSIDLGRPIGEVATVAGKMIQQQAVQQEKRFPWPLINRWTSVDWQRWKRSMMPFQTNQLLVEYFHSSRAIAIDGDGGKTLKLAIVFALLAAILGHGLYFYLLFPTRGETMGGSSSSLMVVEWELLIWAQFGYLLGVDRWMWIQLPVCALMIAHFYVVLYWRAPQRLFWSEIHRIMFVHVNLYRKGSARILQRIALVGMNGVQAIKLATSMFCWICFECLTCNLLHSSSRVFVSELSTVSA